LNFRRATVLSSASVTKATRNNVENLNYWYRCRQYMFQAERCRAHTYQATQMNVNYSHLHFPPNTTVVCEHQSVNVISADNSHPGKVWTTDSVCSCVPHRMERRRSPEKV